MDKNNIGTWIYGIGATEDLDSSGERIKIEGVDISSLADSGVFNFEHKSEEPNQVVGKILEAKKILKKEDCENEHHEYFWEKAGKRPYLYVAGVLFDKFNHPGAISVAAMLGFDTLTDKKKTKHIVNFSIEGSRLDKKGAWINKCIARKITVTVAACNKRCIAELLENPDKTKKISKESLFEIFKKCEDLEDDLKKNMQSKLRPSAGKYSSSLSFKAKPRVSAKESFKPAVPSAGQHKEGTAIKPKRTMAATQVGDTDKLKAGDKVTYQTAKPKTGKDIYSDPDTWKSEDKKTKKKKKLDKFFSSNVHKALVAGCGMGAPSTKVGGDALSKEQVKKVFKFMSKDAFGRFEKKEELLSFLSKRLPNCNSNEIKALAKAVAYVSEKKKESKLDNMVKAKVDEDKTANQKKAARKERADFKPKTKEKWTTPDESGNQFRTANINKKPSKEERKKKVAESKAKRGKDNYPSSDDLGYPMAASEEV